MPDSSLLASAEHMDALPLPTHDVAATTATAGRVTLGSSTYGTIGLANDHDWYAVTLAAGQTYDFRLLGVGRDPLTDTLLTLRNASGTVLISNDDGDGELSLNSSLTFTVSTSGTYFLDAGHFGSGTGDFIISAVRHNAAGMVLTADEVAWQLTNNFGRYFDAQASENVPATAYDLSGGRSISYNITQLTAAGKALAVQALRMWADVTGINFVQTSGAAQISFDDSEAGINAYNNNVTSADGTITSSSLMVTTGWLSEFGTTLDSYSFETTVHELGHALGLGHGGNYNGSASYGTDNFYVNDSQHLSIMSYMQSMHDEFSRDGTDYNTFSNAQFRWVLTPMIADILAMSNLYGLSTTTRTGNTTYGYNSNTGNAALDQAVTLNNPANDNYVAFTIFDNGGTDTVDMSGFSGAQRIDLRQGTSSDVLGGRLNMGIAYGTVVENAYGGSGADTITGSGGSNSLRGNGGNDRLIGSSGNDVLDGGTGNDALFGGTGVDHLKGGIGNDVLKGDSGNDIYYIDSLNDQIIEIAGGGTGDRVIISRSFSLGADDDIELMTTSSASSVATMTLTGNAVSQRIVGNEGGNRINGLAGNDSLVGAGGADTLNGGLGRDRLEGGAGLDVFVFNATVWTANADTIIGYVATDDRIQLDDAVFALSAVTSANFAANLTGLAVRAADRIIYETDTGNLFYDADGFGGAAGRLFANIGANVAGFGAGEFSII